MLVLFLVLLYVFVFAGWGMLFSRLWLKPDPQEKFTLAENALVGMLVCLMLNLGLHFVIPLNSTVSLVLGWLGLFSFFALGKMALVEMRPFVTALLVLALILSFSSYVPQPLYDTGFYHLQNLLWLRESVIPIGLGNLFGNFAFNSAVLPLANMMWLPGSELVGPMVINAVIAMVFFLLLIENFLAAGAQPHSVFAGLLLIFFCLPRAIGSFQHVIFDGLGSPNTDTPAALFTLIAVLFLLKFWEVERWSFLFLSVVAASLATMSKISHALIFLLYWPALSFVFKLQSKIILRVVGFVSLAFVFWIVRNVLLSGCLAFPSVGTCLNLSWTVPTEEVVNNLNWIKAWAREPGASPELILNNYSWLWEWTVRFFRSAFHKNLVYLLVIGLVLNLPSVQRKIKRGESVYSAKWSVFGVSVLALVVWFFQAPDPRFGFGFLILVAVLPLCFSLSRSGLWMSRYAMRRACVSFFILLLFVNPKLLTGLEVIRAGNFPNIPLEIELEALQSQNGVTFYSPKTGDQCWLSPRPCTPLKSTTLVIDSLGRYPVFTKR